VFSAADMGTVLTSQGTSTAFPTLTIDGVTLSAGTASAGGCLRQTRGTVTFTDSTLTDCVGTTTGGGVYLSAGTLSLSNVTVEANTANGGGGIYVAGGTLTLTDTDVAANTGTNGAGIYAAAGTVTLTRVAVLDNVATTSGGGLVANIGLTMTDSTMQGNRAASGGAVYFNTSASLTVQLTNTLVTGNQATGSGAGAYVASGGTLACTGTTTGTYGFQSNAATTSGGGVYLASTTGTLRSTVCDWGSTTPTNNTPDDIRFVSNSYNKGNNASFTCTAGSCP
jgi:predicted outer membrane repeat protein